MKRVILPLLILCSFFLAGCLPSKTNQPITGTDEEKMEKIADIMMAKGSVECLVTEIATGDKTTMKIKGDKVKVVGGKLAEGKMGTMINDAEYTYTWADGQTTGMKVKNPEMTETSPTGDVSEVQESEEDPSAMYDDETKYVTECGEVNIDDSEFVPPTDVKFIDPTTMQQMTPEELMKLYPSN